MSTWIFQSSPAQYDLPAALDALDTITWLVNRYKDEIEVGDTAYLWETGDSAGIVGVGRVMTRPEELVESTDEQRFWREPDEFRGPRLRVRVGVERVLKPRVLRTRIKENDALSGLANLKFAQGTNFPVTADQADQIERMINELAPTNVEERREPSPPNQGTANTTQSWLILQSPGSLYGDVEGVAYHYPLRIPNARRVSAGDAIVVCRPAKHAENDERLIGVGRVGWVDVDGTEASAYYDRYLILSPGRSFQDIGGDPRNNQTNSINNLPGNVLARLLRLAGYGSVDELPAVTAQPPPPRPPRSAAQPAMTFERLLEETLWDEAGLRQLVEAIRDTSPQVALAGPPGTSKTWLAQLIADHLTSGRAGAKTVVQFHPSYAYEQFIEGLRPVVKAGGIAFEMVPGIVQSVVAQMRRDPGIHVVVIDEMNRANLPKVFGELMYLFEYRDQPIDLQYSKDFRLPDDLRFIGTMNTADRSIRSIDVALRRRFDVFDCPPDTGILERYYQRVGRNDVDGLLDGLVRLNGELEAALDRHHTIGHTFLMARLMDATRLHFVWTHKIAPLIEEYFFDQPDLAKAFQIETFWPSVK